MARGTPVCVKGSVGVGTEQVYTMAKLIETTLVAYLSAGNPAWEVADIISATHATYSVVMHSVGDQSLGSGANIGDADIWVKLTVSTATLNCNAYSDWSPTSHTGNRVTSAGTNTMSNLAAYDYWICCNEYECVAIFKQSGTTYMFHFGHQIMGPKGKIGGIARLTAATAGTGVVVLSVDRDISAQLTVGQSVWLCNQTPTGDALAANYMEIVTVDARTSGTVTVSGVTNTPYQIGSLVGLYSGVTFVMGGSTWTGAYSCTARDNASGPVTSGTTAIADNTESYHDPDASNLYPMFDAIYTLNTYGEFGMLQLVKACANGVQATGDRMLIDGDSTNAWWVFPSLAHPTNAYVVCIGPGATP